MRGMRFALGVAIAAACLAAPLRVCAEAASAEAAPGATDGDVEDVEDHTNDDGAVPLLDSGALGLTLSDDGKHAALEELVVEARKPDTLTLCDFCGRMLYFAP